MDLQGPGWVRNRVISSSPSDTSFDNASPNQPRRMSLGQVGSRADRGLPWLTATRVGVLLDEVRAVLGGASFLIQAESTRHG